eukprot:GHRQ01032835.1.p2 GENE.GHRQ01032835.1~~GHRQ01032835.1.p2  ORF type:complete len:101 (-),score=46.14 GHRQ01032835.1:507-809(-)
MACYTFKLDKPTHHCTQRTLHHSKHCALLLLLLLLLLHRGYTRKEPFANHNFGFNWTPKAENWNGRIAMMGFTGMLFTEWISGVNTLQAWGLQSIPFPHL